MARDFELKFVDRELANELRNLKIDDLQVGQRINFTDCADPEVMAASNQVLTFIVTSGSSVALSLFSAWLYDKLKGKKSNNSIKINGIEVSGNSNNLKIEIHNHINGTKDAEK
ncbi:hypothetical protein [Vibrio parahaemolyticus]|jgi:hypothetical protein|uniref:hypothetical protein n=3 Tax=Vibrio parahaemolyticus TaxID=670 RepID=UPI0003CCC4B4|nr:hypothetical protein [Vibrio parahaemolyticus]ASZ51778.1 hypothetical protein YA91_14945 [Vibrio parahaemolyticus]EGQ7710986.1 hypothetical protein [Vibrio parahaemolyticus]EGQ7771121.1 hypothetical protein [Vibrio parahaemolyticus]EGQ7801941.1 hypothetical protein [Vibrio parahaemolyticus]EGQ7862194.1 hypothetical protein [Vibrio parahaemolyticus]